MGSVLPRRAGWFAGCLLAVVAVVAVSVPASESARRYGCEQPIRLALYENRVFYHDGQGIDPDMVAEWLRLIEGMRLDGSLVAILHRHAPPHLTEELLSSGYRYDLARREGQP